MTEMAPEAHVPDAITKVARNLSAIERLIVDLAEQAIHDANDRDIPGGDALAARAHVASPEAWENVYEAAEANGLDVSHIADEDETDEPPLQTLLFWSEQWRTEHGYLLDGRPTIGSEVNFIRWCLPWAWDNEPRFADMARDVSKARRRLEEVLYDGIRVERGVPCMYDACKGARIIRKINHRGERTNWFCPRCERDWTEDRYASMVTAANEAAKFEHIADETWCSVDYAARDIERSIKTVRTWINRGELTTACLIVGRRKPFVNLRQVRARHAAALKKEKWVAA